MRKQAKTVTFCITGALDKMRRVDAIQLIQMRLMQDGYLGYQKILII